MTSSRPGPRNTTARTLVSAHARNEVTPSGVERGSPYHSQVAGHILPIACSAQILTGALGWRLALAGFGEQARFPALHLTAFSQKGVGSTCELRTDAVEQTRGCLGIRLELRQSSCWVDRALKQRRGSIRGGGPPGIGWPG